METKELLVLICEDIELGKAIVREHLEAGKITYANMLPSEKRESIVSALEALE